MIAMATSLDAQRRQILKANERKTTGGIQNKQQQETMMMNFVNAKLSFPCSAF
jgi:hypothetical protein